MLRKRILASLAAVVMAATVAVIAPTASSQAEVSAQACSFTNWTAGTWYPVGSIVKYTNGQYYRAKNENPGYDPIISTWFWEPTSCDGGGTPGGGTCAGAPNWAAGTWYPAGSIVKYTNGQYYRAKNENPGYDPIISTWYWEPHSCDGGGGDPGGFIISESQFDQMFPRSSRNSFYTFQGFVDAARMHPAFAGTGSDTVKKQEIAAFLANASHETGGLVYIEEINKNNDLCDESRPYGCPAGTYAYYGRGPIQLSWNFNYKAAGDYLGISDLLDKPQQVATNSTTAWRTAIWYWMTQNGPGSMTAHNAMVNSAGFGQTIRSINGSLECDGRNPAQVQSRVSKYQQFTGIIGVAQGGNLYC
ncbi:chitinase [Lentzea sp. NBC_00516]|uniref:chitinase n=1 Tax=Lentzea sp. NBC_00516 TaxID=2903582 RepID=UPI002E7FED3C|nr:chitinase [Lentzea sp. NBC_00516]WUD29703.1 chitinase [Lentzea sp. NBC_00516]